MYFVYKKNNLTVFFYYLYSFFKAFFKVATVFCARNHTRNIQRKHRFIGENFGDCAFYYRLRKPFDNRTLSHARLTY